MSLKEDRRRKRETRSSPINCVTVGGRFYPAPDLRPIPGYAGYSAGADGNIYSWLRQQGPGPWVIDETRPPHILKAGANGSSTFVQLGISNPHQVSRLVWKSWFGDLGDDEFVCHKNDDWKDNRPENLVKKPRIQHLKDQSGPASVAAGLVHRERAKRNIT